MSLMRRNHAQSYDSLLLQSYDSFSVFFEFAGLLFVFASLAFVQL